MLLVKAVAVSQRAQGLLPRLQPLEITSLVGSALPRVAQETAEFSIHPDSTAMSDGLSPDLSDGSSDDLSDDLSAEALAKVEALA